MNRLRPTAFRKRQTGAVLFIALIALVSLMIAAVALTRSSDTATLVANNISLRQSALSSADGGLEAAVAWLDSIAKAHPGVDPKDVASHPFSATSAANGYYSYVREGETYLTAAATWATEASRHLGKDPSGNDVSYIIERMCNVENQPLNSIQCLISDAEPPPSSENEDGGYEPKINPIYRVTVRTTGPKNTVAYSQAFVY